jgi:hypothetical protein
MNNTVRSLLLDILIVMSLTFFLGPIVGDLIPDGNAAQLDSGMSPADHAQGPLQFAQGIDRLNSVPGVNSAVPFTLYAPMILRELLNWARNDSYATTCAEDDNVNVPVFARQINRFRVTATHPIYTVGVDNCNADFSGCLTSKIQATDNCTKLFDDSINVVEGCTVTGWWRPYTMNIVVGTGTGSYHYMRLYRKIQDQNSWPQFLVVYEDGNMRLKPHPPAGASDVCFGSSVIFGPAAPATRPYVDIQEVQVNPSAMTLDLTYKSGGMAHVSLSVDRTRAIALVDVNYPSNQNSPIAIFRSMYVSDGNADTDHMQFTAGDLSVLTGWENSEGPWWLFHRTIRSKHNTSAPDIRIEVLN